MAEKMHFLLILCFAFTISAVPPAAPLEGLLNNGDFKQGPKPRDLKKRVIQGKHGLPGWEINGVVEYISGNVSHGVRLGRGASISQTVHVKNGSIYALTIGASTRCAQDEMLTLTVPPQSGEIPIYGSNTYAWGFRAYCDSVTLTFQNPAMQQDPACSPIIDAVAIKQLFHPMPTAGNLVRNSGFEEGPYLLKNSSRGVLLTPEGQDSSSPLPGWIIESTKAVKLIDSEHFSVPYGKGAVELVAGKESAIAQVIRTVPDTTYTLAFVAGDAKNGCHGSMMVEAIAAKDSMKASFKSEGRGKFSSYSFQFTAESNRTRLSFFSSFYHTRSNNYGTLCGPVLDQVRVLPAPKI